MDKETKPGGRAESMKRAWAARRAADEMVAQWTEKPICICGCGGQLEKAGKGFGPDDVSGRARRKVEGEGAECYSRQSRAGHDSGNRQSVAEQVGIPQDQAGTGTGIQVNEIDYG